MCVCVCVCVRACQRANLFWRATTALVAVVDDDGDDEVYLHVVGDDDGDDEVYAWGNSDNRLSHEDLVGVQFRTNANGGKSSPVAPADTPTNTPANTPADTRLRRCCC